jgi:hypothetical protein
LRLFNTRKQAAAGRRKNDIPSAPENVDIRNFSETMCADVSGVTTPDAGTG